MFLIAWGFVYGKMVQREECNYEEIKFCYTIVLVLMLLISCLTKKSSEKAITNVNGLTWDGETITADLHQADSFSFSGRISVSRGATWNLYLDEEGKTPVFNKVLTLSDGENQAFIIVKPKTAPRRFIR